MNKILLLLLFIIPLSLFGQVESQFNGTLNVFSGSRIGSTNTFTISGIFSSTTSQYTSANSAVGDIVQVQSGNRFYWLHIYSIASNSGGVITGNVRDSSSTLTTFPLGKWSIFRPTPNLRLPLSPDGETNASRSATFNTLALRVDEIQTSVASATNCEQTFTKASHGFRKGTPVFWNGSTYIRPTADSLVPDYIVVDSLTANTFKVATCGTYTTTLTNGLYWFTSASPGYSLTQDTTKVPLFQALNGKLILNPIVGFNLMSGSGDVTSSVLADTAAAIRADFPSGGFSLSTYSDSTNTVYVYPGDIPSVKLDETPSGGTLVFLPGIHEHCVDTLNAVLYVDKSVNIVIQPGAEIKVEDNCNLMIDSIQISRVYYAITGLDDIDARDASGTVTSAENDKKIVVTITNTASSPDQFTVSGTGATNGVYSMTGGWQSIGGGVEVFFNSVDGHTLGDLWYLLTSATPIYPIRIGRGFQTDTIKNVTISGGGKINGNVYNNLTVNDLATESNGGIVGFGLIKNVRIFDIELYKCERPIFFAGRHSGAFNANGTTTGGTDYMVKNIYIDNVYAHDNVSSILFGHPSYRGTVRNVSVTNCQIFATRTALEPNHRLDTFLFANNIIWSKNQYGIHLWRSPANGLIQNNHILKGGIDDSAPVGWYRSSSLNTVKNYSENANSIVSGILDTRALRANGSSTFTTGVGVEISYSSAGFINAYSRTGSTYQQLNLNNSIRFDGGANTNATLTNLKTITGTHTSGQGLIVFKGDAGSGFVGLDNTSTGESGFLLMNTGTLIGQAGVRGSDNAFYFKNRISSSNDIITLASNGNIGVNNTTPTSRLQVTGSFSLSTTTISSATTLGEHAIVFATGASTYLVTLPTASTCVGRRYIIKVNGGAKTISSYLDLTGSASTTLTNNTVLTIVSDGTNWQQL